MESIQALRERRAHFARETRKLLDDHPGTKWGKEQQEKYDANMVEIDAADSAISRTQKQLDLEAEKHFKDVTDVNPGSESAKAMRAIYNKWLRGGDKALNQDDYGVIRATLSTTTTTEGGFTVQTEIASTLIDKLKDYGGMRAMAEIIPTAMGNPMNFPTSDGTAEVGELIGENVTATGADPVFGSVGLNVFKYSSKIVACPFELLQDSQLDIETFINARLVTRLGRITNQHYTTGTGSGQPNGLVTASSVGKQGIAGQTLTVIYDDLVDVIDSVDVAYQNLNNCKWMFGQTMRKVVRKIKDSAGRPIWTPSYDAGITGSFTDQLLGYPVQINNDMPVPAASAKTMSFGDHRYYKIRDVMSATLFRFTDSAYTKLGQVGFLAWMRSGGNMVDTAAVKLYQHSAT